MLFSYRLTSFIIGFFIAGIILQLVRKDLLHTKYSIMWFCFAVSAAIFGMFPQLSDKIADLFGVNYGPILFVVTGMGIILIKILTMDIDRSHLEQKIRKLNEKIAVLDGELTEAQKNIGANISERTDADID